MRHDELSVTITELHWKALAASEGLTSSPSHIERVSKGTSPDAARWAFEQWALRERAKVKFSLARDMLFTRSTLEMATHERVARWRASRFPVDALVQDLTCGIGGDMMALAQRGQSEGYEISSEVATYARHNLALLSPKHSKIHQADGLHSPPAEFALADPARRNGAGRTLDPDSFQPDPQAVAERFARIRLGAIKLSPMLPDPFLESLGPELAFVSHKGECCEAVVWCGSESTRGRYAVHVESGKVLAARTRLDRTDAPSVWMYEADAAAIRAHALGSIPGDWTHLGDSPGYLTGGMLAPSPWINAYRVEWNGPYRPEKVSEALRKLAARVTVVKKRGVPLEPKDIKVKAGGDVSLTLVLWPVGKKVRCALVRPAETG